MKFAVPGEECFRKCSTLSTEDRKVCHFKFQLEYYQVLGGYAECRFLKLSAKIALVFQSLFQLYNV